MKITVNITAEEKTRINKVINTIKNVIVQPCKDVIQQVMSLPSGKKLKKSAERVKVPTKEFFENSAIITTEDYSDGVNVSLEIKSDFIGRCCDLAEDAANTLSPAIGSMVGTIMVFAGSIASISEKAATFIDDHKRRNHENDQYYVLERNQYIAEKNDRHDRFLFRISEWGCCEVAAHAHIMSKAADKATDLSTELLVEHNLCEEIEDLLQNGMLHESKKFKRVEIPEGEWNSRVGKILHNLGWFTEDDLKHDRLHHTVIEECGHWDDEKGAWISGTEID